MTTFPKWVIPTAIVVAVLFIASLAYQHFTKRGVDPAVRDEIAVVKASKVPDSVAHATTVAVAETAHVQSRATERRAQVHKQRADSAAAAAAVSTTAQDSAEHWHVAFLEERKRADSLEVALVKERMASLASQRADSLSQDRLARVERLNANLEKELNRVSSGCHLLPGIRCPTRKETALGAAAITYLALSGRLHLPGH